MARREAPGHRGRIWVGLQCICLSCFRSGFSSKWLKAVLSIIVSVVCFLMALAFVVLGPAAITMLEQMG